MSIWGSGYSTAPILSIQAPPNGTTATVTSTIVTSAVVSVGITGTQTGFTKTNAVFTWTCTATTGTSINPTCVYTWNTAGTSLTSISITDPGNNINSCTFVATCAGATSLPTLTPVIKNGIVVYTINNMGSGYTSTPPLITFSGGSGANIILSTCTSILSTTQSLNTITMTNAGQSLLPGNLLITDAPGDTTGVNAQASFQVDSNGSINSVTITNRGSGYSLPPVVSFMSLDPNSSLGFLMGGSPNTGTGKGSNYIPSPYYGSGTTLPNMTPSGKTSGPMSRVLNGFGVDSWNGCTKMTTYEAGSEFADITMNSHTDYSFLPAVIFNNNTGKINFTIPGLMDLGTLDGNSQPNQPLNNQGNSTIQGSPIFHNLYRGFYLITNNHVNLLKTLGFMHSKTAKLDTFTQDRFGFGITLVPTVNLNSLNIPTVSYNLDSKIVLQNNIVTARNSYTLLTAHRCLNLSYPNFLYVGIDQIHSNNRVSIFNMSNPHILAKIPTADHSFGEVIQYSNTAPFEQFVSNINWNACQFRIFDENGNSVNWNGGYWTISLGIRFAVDVGARAMQDTTLGRNFRPVVFDAFQDPLRDQNDHQQKILKRNRAGSMIQD